MFYKNLSTVPFVFRTISELKTAVAHTDDDKIYSLIEYRCYYLVAGFWT